MGITELSKAFANLDRLAAQLAARKDTMAASSAAMRLSLSACLKPARDGVTEQDLVSQIEATQRYVDACTGLLSAHAAFEEAQGAIIRQLIG